MLVSLKDRLEVVAGATSALAQTHAKLILLFALLLSLAGMTFVKNEIGINTDTENMLAEKLPWRATYRDFKANFPAFTDTLVIVVDAATPDLAADIARDLSDRIAQDGKHFHTVTYAAESPFIRRNQFLYLTETQLQKLADRLSRSQAVISQLLDDPSAKQLFATINKAFTTDHADQVDGLDTLNTQLASAFDHTREQIFVPMSWQTLFDPDTASAPDKSTHRVIFTAKPIMDFSAILPAQAAIESLRKDIATIEAEYPDLVHVRITGSAALSHDEMLSVINGSMKAGLFAMLMVLACLFIGLRSWVLVLSTLITLIVGLTFTATFAVAAVGTLNMISIAFAVLYVGLGVDFAIHTCLRYKELLSEGEQTSRFRTLNNAVRHVGASIALCALTTAIGFFAFIPTDFQGVAELGLIAGVGMFISLFTTLLVLPALLQILPVPSLRKTLIATDLTGKIVTPGNAKAILVVAGCLWFIASISVSFVSFDINPLNLNDQNAQSVRLIKELARSGDVDLYSISVLANDRDEMDMLTRKLEKLVSVKSVTKIDELIPKNQAEKFYILDDLVLIIGDELEVKKKRPAAPAALLSELQNLKNNLQQLPDDEIRDSEKTLLSALSSYLSSIAQLNDDQQAAQLALLEKNLMTSFSARIERLNDALNPTEVNVGSLPTTLRELWLSPQGKFRIEVVPREDLSRNHSLQAFVDEVRGVIGDRATGTAVINVGAAEAVQEAFTQAFAYALTLITILLWLILRSIKEMIVTLFPLLLAGLLTSGVVVLLDLQFNFANVIALPLLLGIGVDSAIHLLHRYKTEPNQQLGILQTSTARAVFFSAATTTVSFGNLAISNHAGTASMGIVLTIGILAVLFCMLIIFPAMLLMFVNKPISTAP